MAWTEQPNESESWDEAAAPDSDSYVVSAGYWKRGYVVSDLWAENSDQEDTWQSL